MDLEEVIAAFGIRIIETQSLRPDIDAMYLRGRSLILLRSGLDWWTRRSVLAHELAHHIHLDTDFADPRAEKRADLWAANLLISPVEYAAAEQLHDGHIGAIAHELGVTPHLAMVWRDHHLALKEAT